MKLDLVKKKSFTWIATVVFHNNVKIVYIGNNCQPFFVLYYILHSGKIFCSHHQTPNHQFDKALFSVILNNSSTMEVIDLQF